MKNNENFAVINIVKNQDDALLKKIITEKMSRIISVEVNNCANSDFLTGKEIKSA